MFQQAIMVGDTVADLKMGRVAGLRASIGVLTGVGTRESLKEYTDYFVSSSFTFQYKKASAMITACYRSTTSASFHG